MLQLVGFSGFRGFHYIRGCYLGVPDKLKHIGPFVEVVIFSLDKADTHRTGLLGLTL